MSQLLSEMPVAWSFAEDFDLAAHDEVGTAEPEFIEPVYSLADLEAARLHASMAARAQADAEAARSLAAQSAAACARIAQTLAASQATAAELAEAVARPLAGAVLAALRAALPDLYRAHGAREAAALVAMLTPALRCMPRAVITLHPTTHESLIGTAALGALDADRLSMRADPSLEPGDVHITWEDGSARRDLAALLAGLDDILELDGVLEVSNGR